MINNDRIDRIEQAVCTSIGETGRASPGARDSHEVGSDFEPTA